MDSGRRLAGTSGGSGAASGQATGVHRSAGRRRARGGCGPIRLSVTQSTCQAVCQSVNCRPTGMHVGTRSYTHAHACTSTHTYAHEGHVQTAQRTHTHAAGCYLPYRAAGRCCVGIEPTKPSFLCMLLPLPSGVALLANGPCHPHLAGRCLGGAGAPGARARPHGHASGSPGANCGSARGHHHRRPGTPASLWGAGRGAVGQRGAGL